MAQRHGALADAVELFLARVAVDALGDADHGDILDPMLRHDRGHGAHLPRAAVDQQQIRPKAPAAVRVFFDKPFEAAVQHLFHHAEVIARGQVIAADVELAVLVFHHAFRPRHDHRADGIGALDMRVVVNLDPLGRLGQVKGIGQPLQELGLGRRLGHLAGKAFARIAQGPVDQFGLLTPFRHQEFDLTAQLAAQRLGHQIGVLDLIAEDQLPRRLAGVVELADEGLQHLGGVDLAPDPGVIVVVAPVLVGADEEDLHAGLTAFHMQRDNVGLVHPLRVDALGGLNLRQRLDPVAQGGCAFELHRL